MPDYQHERTQPFGASIISDTRQQWKIEHKLPGILFLIIVAVIPACIEKTDYTIPEELCASSHSG